MNVEAFFTVQHSSHVYFKSGEMHGEKISYTLPGSRVDRMSQIWTLT